MSKPALISILIIFAGAVVAQAPPPQVAVQQLTFNLPNHERYTGIVERTGQPVAGSRSWSGPLTGVEGSFTLVEYGKQRFLRIHLPTKVLEIATGTPLREIAPDTVPECGVGVAPASVISAPAIPPCTGVATAVAPAAAM